MKPAGGAALDQVLIASGAAAALTAVLLVFGWGHRTGRITLLTRLADWAAKGPGRGLPGWAALPSLVAIVSLITALLGMYWDISLHISQGRDEGPLANIAHYPILIGLFGIFTAGALAVVLPKGERPGGAAVRITRDWYSPAGGVLLAGAGFYALLGFPLDDVWHRIFGQDVTLWGPTHLMLIGGAGLSLVAMAVLEREGRLVRDGAGGTGAGPVLRYVRRGMIMGGLLIGLSVFQAEWDFGVPQFRMAHQPMLIALAAGCALVAARLWTGRGGALFAVGFYVLVRGGVAVAVGPVIGELFPVIPLYLAEAVLVELAAIALARRPLLLGVAGGLLVGTLGFAAEYAWTQVAFRLPWTPGMVPEGLLMAAGGGLAGGVLGALLVLGLTGRLPRPAVARSLFAGALALVAVLVGNGLLTTVPTGVRAELALAATASGGRTGSPGTAQATVRLTPPVDGPTWLTVTAWQGGGLHVDHLVRTGEGTYRTTEPMPLTGTWKTLIRLHDGRKMVGIPIYLPRDEAIGADEVPAAPAMTREGQPEQRILQRELNPNVPTWTWAAASAVVLACTLALILTLAWGVSRLSRTHPKGPR
ncbi:hypothetical protein D5H75_28705 [Bailinhaonella thermotolerans]|uniref:Uncharacterized protein n=1 Tax=Bailinhaonella thermotolerans TaxID=1070861 RepID=A0A3A4A9Y7_9ACTN|nr:hypothetical protein D5H75_28705 [Bailinhaonella thermotolerans]